MGTSSQKGEGQIVCHTTLNSSQRVLHLHQRPAFQSWNVVQNIVRQLGMKDFAFARPEGLAASEVPRTGTRLTWIGPKGPEPQQLSGLPPEKRQRLEKRLRLIFPALRSAARAKGPECAALMDLALQVPDLSSLWVIDEWVVLAPWGISVHPAPQERQGRPPETPLASSPLADFLGLGSTIPASSPTPHTAPSPPSSSRVLKPFYVPAGLALWLSVVLCVGVGLLFFWLAFRTVLFLGLGPLWPAAFSLS